MALVGASCTIYMFEESIPIRKKNLGTMVGRMRAVVPRVKDDVEWLLRMYLMVVTRCVLDLTWYLILMI